MYFSRISVSWVQRRTNFRRYDYDAFSLTVGVALSKFRDLVKMTWVRALLAILFAGASAGSVFAADAGAPPHKLVRPNLIVILADDLGYTDLGAYGSEIPTPNLDALAHSGIMFTNFHSAPACSPTRAMLLSGTDNHQAGLGNMAEELTSNQIGHRGYEGYLNFHVASLASVLRDGGYHTYMTGKWHLGLTKQTSPHARGFEKSFTMLQGGAGHFSNMLPVVGPGKALYREDGKRVTHLPADFYSPEFYTEKMIQYIESNRGDGKPFFAYLAYTMPHWPLQASPASIAKEKGKYEEGYDVLHDQRVARLKALGIIPENADEWPRLPGEPAWKDLSPEQKKYEARRMQVYAAMVMDLDHYVGVMVNYLKRTGQFDNTFILFMSDNGAEGHDLPRGWPQLAKWVKQCCNDSYANMGKPDSYLWLGRNWGRAAVGPWRMFKGFTSEGGIRVPAFVHFPGLPGNGTINRHFASVMDVMPTLLQLAHVKDPVGTYHGHKIVPMQGTSMLAMLEGEQTAVHKPGYAMGWELFGKRAIRLGNWKIIYRPYMKVFEPLPKGVKTDTWQLYNLAQDPAELHDLSKKYPDKLKELVDLWKQYASHNHVIIPNDAGEY